MPHFSERIQRPGAIFSTTISDLQRSVRERGFVVSSPHITAEETGRGVALHLTQDILDRIGGGTTSVFFGTAAADYSSGSTISLTPCDANGVATGESAVTVTIPTSWGTVNLLSATVGGVDAVTVTCKIASGTLLQYAYAGATPYLLGLPPTQIMVDEKMTATGLQIKVAWIIGTAASTVSAWMPVYALGIVVSSGAVRLQFTPTGGSATDMSTITTSPSKEVSCTAPGS
jgi:hypothetical protein